MYDVTSQFLEAIKRPYQRHHIRGVIAASAGGTWNFTDANILEGTFNLTNQCTDTSDIVLGSCFLGQLSATFTGLEIFRTNWIDLTITVYFQLYYNQQDYEEVPLGIYTIKEATHTANGVEVVAYDNMYKFDKKFKADGFDRIGIPWEYLTLICQRCGVSIGMSQPDVEALPNGLSNLYLCGVREGTVDYANDIETYRDALFWLCQVTASFATIDRWGELVMKPFKTAQSVDTISDEYRLSGAKFADYVTSYNGIYTESLYDGDVNYYGYDLDALLEMKAENDDRITEIGEEMTELEREHDEHEITDEEYRQRKAALTKDLKRYQKYDKWLEKMIDKASEGDSAYMELGANPLFQRRDSKIPSIAQATLATTLREKIMKAVQKIEYTPFSCDTIFGVHYDLGDVLTFTGGHADDDICCIMSYDWTLHGTYRMEGYGINPDEQNVKDVDKKQSNRAQKNALSATRNTTGSDLPVSPTDGDIHVVVNKINGEPLQSAYFSATSSETYPIYMEDFSGNNNDGYSFNVKGKPSTFGEGENAEFTLQGLEVGVQYKIEFDAQLASGEWHSSSWKDTVNACGTSINLKQYDYTVGHYEFNFTYAANGKLHFFFAEKDYQWFTYSFSNMKISPVNGAIQSLEASVNGEWKNVDYVRNITQQQTSTGGEKIATANNSDGTNTDIYAKKIEANPSGSGSTDLTKLQIGSTIYNLATGGGNDVGLSVGNNGAIQSTYTESSTEHTEDILRDETGDEIATILNSIAGAIQLLGSPEIYAPIVYGTEERLVGVWTDGKPLYQKTLHFTETTEQTEKSYTTEIQALGIDYVKLVNAEVKLGSTGGNDFYSQPFWYSTSLNMMVSVSKSLINIYSRGWKWSEAYVTIQYTKTTDIAGSGPYVALGVPAVHYSTDEQVIGTWIDGKTLYEKTIDCGNMPNNTTKTISIGNIYPKKIEGCMYNPNDENVTRPLPFSSSSVNDNVRVDTEYQNLRIVTSANWSSYKAYITIQYTKP